MRGYRLLFTSAHEDEWDEAAERFLGDLLNLEISFMEEDGLNEEAHEQRRHDLTVEFLGSEFNSLKARPGWIERAAHRLLAVMNECDLGTVIPSEWSAKHAESRTQMVAEFLRDELSRYADSDGAR